MFGTDAIKQIFLLINQNIKSHKPKDKKFKISMFLRQEC